MLVRRAAAAAGLLLVALLLGAVPAGAAGGDGGEGEDAPDLVSFGIAPAGPERADDRPFVAVTAPAGAVVFEHVALINQDDQPIDLDVYARDVLMAEGGGLAVQARADAAADAGAWVTIDAPGRVTVPPQTSDGYGFTIVPITVTIPADAEPGDHVAGLVASIVTAGAGGQNAPNLELEQRVAARLYVTVSGEERPGLAVRDLTASWERSGWLGTGTATVEYTLENTGNVRLAVEPTVAVAGPGGLLRTTAAGDRVDELLPGGSVRVTTTVPRVWAMGRHTVTVDAAVLAAPGGADPGLGTVSADVVMWAVPWLALALLLLLACLVGWAVVRRRRRRGARGRRAA